MNNYYKPFICISLCVITWNTFQLLKIHQNKQEKKKNDLNIKAIKEYFDELDNDIKKSFDDIKKSLRELNKDIDDLKKNICESYLVIN